MPVNKFVVTCKGRKEGDIGPARRYVTVTFYARDALRALELAPKLAADQNPELRHVVAIQAKVDTGN